VCAGGGGRRRGGRERWRRRRVVDRSAGGRQYRDAGQESEPHSVALNTGKMQAAPFSIYVRRAAQVTPTRSRPRCCHCHSINVRKSLALAYRRPAGQGPTTQPGRAVGSCPGPTSTRRAEPLSTCHVPSVPAAPEASWSRTVRRWSTPGCDQVPTSRRNVRPDTTVNGEPVAAVTGELSPPLSLAREILKSG